jgi:hypothetical protein
MWPQRRASYLWRSTIQQGAAIMWTQVESYMLGYNVGTKEFYFYYTLKGQGTANQIFVDAQTFLALSDMFRNERPISYNSQGNYFATGAERVGDNDKRP